MKKSRASLEPFWDLKISKYVEYLTRVSSEYCAVEFVSVIEASKLVAIKVESLRRPLHDFWGQHRLMCTHSIDDLLPHAPLHCMCSYRGDGQVFIQL